MAGAGYKLFQTGDVLTAAQVNTYLNEQTVMVFANAAARTSALTSVLAEGMMSYLQDTNSVEVYNGSSWVNVGNAGDITEVQAGVGISIASGTGPIPVITNSSTDLITTAGDLLYGTAADTVARLGIGTAGQVLKVNSGATAPEWGAPAAPAFVGCSLKKVAAQTTSAATYTVITFTDEDFDTNGFHDNSTNTSRITIPSGYAGKYLITAQLSTGNGDETHTSAIKLNGSNYNTLPSFKSAQSGSGGSVQTLIMNLSVGDYVEIAQYSGGGVQVNGTAQNDRPSVFACQWLGA
jgi:hypothetical protein